jgi:hypothetical protein
VEITKNKNPEASLYRFSIDFKIHTLAHGFFLLEITKIWAKVSRLLVSGFFLEILSIGWFGFSYGFLVALNQFH